MFNQIKTKANQAKQFVQKHPTLTACVVTALVTHKLTYDSTIKGVIEDVTPVAYEWGRENGVLQFERDVLIDFVNQKGLADDAREFIAAIHS